MYDVVSTRDDGGARTPHHPLSSSGLFLTTSHSRLEGTLNQKVLGLCFMRVERYPNPNGGVGNSIPSYENFSLLDSEKTKSPPTTRQATNPTLHQRDPSTGYAQHAQIHIRLPDLIYYYYYGCMM